MKTYEFEGISYKVSEDGEIFGPKVGKIKQRLNSDGYYIVTIGGFNSRRTSERVHRIVAECYCKKPYSEERLEVNHIDMDRKNNNYKNLEWVTHKQNVLHSSSKGRYAGRIIGEKNPKAKLNEEQVLEIKKLIEEGCVTSEICKRFGVGNTAINNIKRKITWKHI